MRTNLAQGCYSEHFQRQLWAAAVLSPQAFPTASCWLLQPWAILARSSGLRTARPGHRPAGTSWECVQQSPGGAGQGQAGQMLRRCWRLSALSTKHSRGRPDKGRTVLGGPLAWLLPIDSLMDPKKEDDSQERTSHTPKARPHAEVMVIYPQKLLWLCQWRFGDVRASFQNWAAKGKTGWSHILIKPDKKTICIRTWSWQFWWDVLILLLSYWVSSLPCTSFLDKWTESPR